VNVTASAGTRIDELLALRAAANAEYFEREADTAARLCHRLAERFARGARLLAIGSTPQARSDARHVAVEFVHPVIVGKRALPALALTPDAGSPSDQVDLIAEPEDIAMAFGGEADAGVRSALAAARERGCLTVAFAPSGAEWELDPGTADPFVRQELAETMYHVLWELVHVFFEHRGLLEGRAARARHDAGASSFLYPFLAEQETDLDSVLDDVRRSVLMKAEEVSALREQTFTEGREALAAAAGVLRGCLDTGGKVLVFGNGGSATDAADAVADFRAAPQGWPARRALDLADDPAILTAIANDIGAEALFARQVIAYGTAGDGAVAISTSGSSANIVAALAEARRRGAATIALVGYDGGRVLAERLADHVVVSRSEHIPRIQEAQASAYHVLRELVELVA
jgi:D-sedoheptulose 7-phosphate isomerase